MISIIVASLIATTALSQTVVQVIASRPELSTLYGAIQEAGLVDALNNTNTNFTIFAPNNGAFANVVVPNQISVLQNLLEYHVINAYILSTDLSSGEYAKTLISQTVTVEIRNGNVGIFDSNGRRGEVTKANLLAVNGVVHEIDAVLLPNGTLANITANIPPLSDLNGALISTGLDKDLSNPTATLTLFAPTNEAVSMFKGTINQNLLLYHVLGSEVFSNDLKTGDNVVPTLDADKDTLDVISNTSGVYVKDKENREGQVILANIAGINGVCHIIDIVLSPVPV